MTLLFSILASLALFVAAGLMVWFLIRGLLEQARLRRALDVQMLQVLLPKDLKPEEKEEGIGEQIKERIAVAEQFLSTLAYLPTSTWDRFLYGPPSIIFEIVAKNDDTIVFYAGTQRQFVDHLEKQIYAHYPDADVSPAAEFTLFEPADTIKVATVGLQRPTHLPIATYKELENDPMQALTGALAKIQNRDSAVIQYVLAPANSRARRKGAKAAKQAFRGKRSDVAAGGSTMLSKAFKDQEKQKKQQEEYSRLTPRAQQRIELVEAKAAQQLFSVTIRVGVSARQADEVDRIINAMAGAFAQYDLPDLNSLRLKVLKSKPEFLRDLIFRVPATSVAWTRQQVAVVLSTTELASLFHFPLPTTGTPNILWRGSKVAPAPAGLPQEGVRLGTNVYRSVETPIYLLPEDRRRHLYLIGQTGTGKTTLFLNMIVQDIAAGHGVAVIDPHGDLIEDILRHVPAQRAGDVVLFDPKDTERPLGFNILEVKQAGQKDLVVNEVVQILQKLAARLNPESIGPMFEHYLRNSLLALAEDPNSTLIDVPRMFVDAKFRTAILSKVTNPTVRQFWDQEFAQSQRGQLSADMLSYVISKLGRFISNETVRNIIGQSHSSFDVRQIMDEKKILLCNLSKGTLGDINSDLLGFVLVSKLQIAALSRADVDESQRTDFYLYLDEFQNFTTDSIGTILSEARKYRLDLNLTHQFIEQLDEKIREAVFGNVGTMISYRVGVEDAEFLEKQFQPVFTDYDLVNLERFTAIAKVLLHNTPQRPFTLKIPPPPAGGSVEAREAVRSLSRERYGRPKDVVEAEILQRFQYGADSPPIKPASGGGGDYMSESLFDVT